MSTSKLPRQRSVKPADQKITSEQVTGKNQSDLQPHTQHLVDCLNGLQTNQRFLRKSSAKEKNTSLSLISERAKRHHQMSTTDLLIKQLEVISHATPSQSLLLPENSTQASQELRYPQLTHIKLRQQIQTLEA